MGTFRPKLLGITSCCLLAFGAICRSEEPARVTVCQLQSGPATYDKKLIEVTGFFSSGFENFSLFDPGCPSGQVTWLEYGGTTASGTIYCCGVDPNRDRPATAIVEGIPVPLIADKQFREFDKLIHQPPDRVTRATVVGRFFAGREERIGGAVLWSGYGHMGCCSLLVIQQVVSVDRRNRADLDFRASSDLPNIEEVGCGFRYLLHSRWGAEALNGQQQADSGDRGWAFNEPRRVAIDVMARIPRIDPVPVAGIRQIRKAQGRLIYEWKAEGSRKSYTVVVSRPYWLSFYAKNEAKVAWVVIGAYESSCE